MHRTKMGLLLACALVATFAISACGSSSSSTSSSSTSSSSTTAAKPAASTLPLATVADRGTGKVGPDGVLPELIAPGTYADHLKTPTNAGIAPPLTKKPPTGLVIQYLLCPLPTCQTQSVWAKEAAAQFGWTVNNIPYALTAEGIKSAFDAAIQASKAAPDKTAGVITSGFPTTAYASELATLKKMGIPVVDAATNNPIGKGLIASLYSDTNDPTAQLMAEYIAHDSGGKGHVVEFNTPDYPSQQRMHLAFQKDLKKLCPGCKYTFGKFNLTDIGPQGSNVVVSAMQRNPDAKYAVFGFGELEQGVPAALSSAGINGTKLVIAGPIQSSYQDVVSGKAAVAIGQATEEQVWCQLDALARYNVGDPVPPNGCTLPVQIITKDTAKAWSSWPAVPGWKDTFKKDWGTAT